jgi:hypothetical protein
VFETEMVRNRQAEVEVLEEGKTRKAEMVVRLLGFALTCRPGGDGGNRQKPKDSTGTGHPAGLTRRAVFQLEWGLSIQRGTSFQATSRT